ncbi:MAG: hypothetical protein QXF55_02760 [Candidatus Aenigmatarchaeota archaeon]
MPDLMTAGLIPFASTFLFLFAIAFAMLAYSDVLKSRAASAVLAAVIAFFAATYAPLVAFMAIVLPLAAAGMAVLFFIVFIREVLFGEKKGRKAEPVPAAIGLALCLVVLGAVWPQIMQSFGFVGVAAENIVYIIGIIAIIIIFWAAYKVWGGSGGGAAPAPAGGG